MEWRYGWSADDPRWTDEQPAVAGTPPADPSASWRLEAWGSPPSEQPPPSWSSPVNGNPYGSPAAYGNGASAYGNGASAYGNGAAPPNLDPRVTTGGMAALRGPSGQQLPVRPGYGMAPPPTPGAAPAYPAPRQPTASRVGPRRRPDFDGPPSRLPDEPRYSVLFALTAAWYTLPAAIYVLWLMTVGSSRVTTSTASVAASAPWLVASLLLSLVVAGLLRWAIVGWRAMTLSFAAAVIGAGVATIAHSLAV